MTWSGYVRSSALAARARPTILLRRLSSPQDPLPLLVSSHTTFWDAGERNRELGLATSDKLPTPAEGDSGSALFLQLFTRFLDWPLLGVASRQYRPDAQNNPELWNSHYAPIQERARLLAGERVWLLKLRVISSGPVTRAALDKIEA
jgi:hypothetical protein